MARSTRLMFLALLAALAIGYLQLRSRNAALEAQAAPTAAVRP